MDKWLRARTTAAEVATAPQSDAPVPAHNHGAAAAGQGGGYGGLGYSRLLPRDHEVVPEYNASAVNWTHTMSAVNGGFQWIAKHGKVGGL